MLRITVHDTLESLAFQLEEKLAALWVRALVECRQQQEVHHVCEGVVIAGSPGHHRGDGPRDRRACPGLSQRRLPPASGRRPRLPSRWPLWPLLRWTLPPPLRRATPPPPLPLRGALPSPTTIQRRSFSPP